MNASEPRFANGEVQIAMSVIDQLSLSIYQRERVIDTFRLLDKTLEQAREKIAELKEQIDCMESDAREAGYLS